MFFGCVIFMTACDKNNGDGPNPPASDDDITDITFNMTEDTVTSPIEGGDLSLGYSLSSRPEEGQFVVTMLSGESWVSYVADNPESNSLTVNVESNDGEPREGILAIRFDYNGGSLLDSVTISQEGKDYDVFIDAKDLDGEYYTGEKDYYIWVSTLGMWETGSEGLNIDLFAEGEPELEDYHILQPFFLRSGFRLLLHPSVLCYGRYCLGETSGRRGYPVRCACSVYGWQVVPPFIYGRLYRPRLC